MSSKALTLPLPLLSDLLGMVHELGTEYAMRDFDIFPAGEGLAKVERGTSAWLLANKKGRYFCDWHDHFTGRAIHLGAPISATFRDEIHETADTIICDHFRADLSDEEWDELYENEPIWELVQVTVEQLLCRQAA